MSNSLVKLHKISKSFDKGVIRALEGIDLTIEEEKTYAICGPSGCGKSTLLQIIGTLEFADSGRVLYMEKDLNEHGDIAKFRRDFFGFVFQFHHLIPVLTLQENIEVAMLPEKEISEINLRVKELLDEIGLQDRSNAKITTLSGGERQRGAIARALANRPKLILADEPTGSVDSTNAQRIAKLLLSTVQQENTTLVLATHDRKLAQQCDVVIEMEDGKIVSMTQGKGIKDEE